MRSYRGPAACAVAAVLLALPHAARAAGADSTVTMPQDPVRYGIVVSATRTRHAAVDVPNALAVVRGDELRRSGARTLAEALADVPGLDIGGGSDEGSRFPNPGLWGLKEFDALLVTVDGVPVGGPFNPALAQINVDDVDRIEIVKGPQGTLHGVSAFAGMIQVFTRHGGGGRAEATLGGGSFGAGHGDLALHQGADALRLDVGLSGGREAGWQDRTGSETERGRVSLSGQTARGSWGLDFGALRDRQDWGSPLPFDPDGGFVRPGFAADRNVAVGGAVAEHRVLTATSRLAQALGGFATLENTFGASRDAQNSVRSFAGDAGGDTLAAAGVALRPLETTLYEDLRLVTRFPLAGAHALVTGGALTWGRTTAAGAGFDFRARLGDPGSIPDVGALPPRDQRAFGDRRTFLGLYAHDEWTPVRRFTLSGGGRWDRTSEALHALDQRTGGPALETSDARAQSAWSGDLAGLVRLAPAGGGRVGALNLYANWKSGFKPAAPNLTGAGDARILDPERTHSLEAGVKTEFLDRQLAVDASAFQLDFHNLVVAAPDSLGNPALINTGHERFRGVEASLTLAPAWLPGLSLSLAGAAHDPRFVDFRSLTPDGTLEDDRGHQIELAPRAMWSGRLALAPRRGLGAWVAARGQGRRALDRDNAFFLAPFHEVDAGLTGAWGRYRAGVSGRNLGDDRHVVAESDIGDAQFYLAPPRRFDGELSVTF